MEIKRIGYYKEMPHGESDDPSILDSIGKVDPELKDKICKYLDSGLVLIECAGTVEDIIDNDKGTAGVPNALTDGIWIWPGDLSYYVRNYDLRIPDVFLETMREKNWSTSLKMDDLDLDDLSIDGEYIFRD